MQEALQDVVRTHERLRRVVTEVLDAARIEHGQVTPAVQPVAVSDLIQRSVDEVEAEIKRKGLELVLEDPGDLTVTADPEHAHRILSGVVRNAVQYTEKGTITIRCFAREDQIAISVVDTGVGMQTAQLAECFAKPKLGTLLHAKGMSLYLARSLAKLMNADVTLVSSELGTGSTFAVSFPRSWGADAQKPAGQDRAATPNA
jgi:signal transduction histidine kinase